MMVTISLPLFSLIILIVSVFVFCPSTKIAFHFLRSFCVWPFSFLLSLSLSLHLLLCSLLLYISYTESIIIGILCIHIKRHRARGTKVQLFLR